MFDSKNTMAKYVGYTLIGFFLLIVVYSFGMPDQGFNCGADRDTALNINGEKIHVYEFAKLRKLKLGEKVNPQMENYFASSLIVMVLIMQEAERQGIQYSDDRISYFIKKEFTDPVTGQYNSRELQNFLRGTMLSLIEYERLVRMQSSQMDLFYYISRGIPVTKDELNFRSFINETKIQVKYAYLSNEEIRKRYSTELEVTDSEIDSEIASKKTKISDPKSDRERIRKEIASKKLEKVKNDIIEKVNAVASSGGSFDAASSLLKGVVSKSAPFKIGEEIKSDEKEPKPAGALGNSGVFMDRVLVMNLNSASPVINSAAGLYIFTPISREYQKTEGKTPEELEADAEALKKTENDAVSAGVYAIRSSLLTYLEQKSKIIKNLKTD